MAHDLAWALHHLAVAAAAVDVSLARRLRLNPVDYQAMKHLMTATTALGPVELGALVGLTSGSATGLVDRLERAGHLRREPDPRDRRRLVLHPTAQALAATVEALRPLEDAVERITHGYTAKEREVVGRFLREITDAYRAQS